MKKITLLITLLISGTVFAFNFASPSESSAKIVMNYSNDAKQLFPVKLLMVNGENVSPREDAVWLEPGEYVLRFATTINGDYTQEVMGLKERHGLKALNNTLTLNVEADKSYYVAFDASSTQTDQWGPVVYKVK
ncbi:MAG: hypothetical protein R3E90_12665 [Marinicella sp.]